MHPSASLYYLKRRWTGITGTIFCKYGRANRLVGGSRVRGRGRGAASGARGTQVESFLRRPHSRRDHLGACLADSSFPDGATKRLMQSVGLQFTRRALLHQWGKEDSPNCPFCKEKESLGHIQSRCKALEKPRMIGERFCFNSSTFPEMKGMNTSG